MPTAQGCVLLNGHLRELVPFLRCRHQISPKQARRSYVLVPCHAAKTPATPPGDDSGTSHSVDPISWRWRVNLAGDMLKFALPAIGIPLAEPLMSLVDSVAIAQAAGSRSLAAMGPNSLIFSFGYVFNALSIATIRQGRGIQNQASACIRRLGSPQTLRVGCGCIMTELLQQGDNAAASRVLMTSLAVAFSCGCLVLILLQTRGPQLIAATGCAPELLELAWEYMRIRAFAMPAALVLMNAQAGLLAQRDSLRPLLAVVVQLTANIVGTYWLVVVLHRGVAGCAWATVFSDVLGALLALGALQTSAKLSVPMACVLSGLLVQHQVPNLVQLRLEFPQWSDVCRLAATFGPTTFIYVCKNVCYAIIQGAATCLPARHLAAHQGAWSLWALTSFAQTPMEQAALAFVPAQPAGSSKRRNAVGVIMALGAVSGLVTGLLCCGVLACLPALLTPDTALWPLMAHIAPQAFLAIVLCGLDVASTGILIASKRLGLLVKAMALTLACIAAYYWKLRPAGGYRLGGVWWGLVLFFSLRMVQSSAGMLQMYLPRGRVEHTVGS